MINDHLALVGEGNGVVEKAILDEIGNCTDKDQLNTNDLCDMIRDFYFWAAVDGDYHTLMLPFHCLIAGKNRDGSPSLINAENVKGRFDAQEVPMALYPIPQEILPVYRNNITQHYRFYYLESVRKKIHEISKICPQASDTGSKWIYDARTQRGCCVSFKLNIKRQKTFPQNA